MFSFPPPHWDFCRLCLLFGTECIFGQVFAELLSGTECILYQVSAELLSVVFGLRGTGPSGEFFHQGISQRSSGSTSHLAFHSLVQTLGGNKKRVTGQPHLRIPGLPVSWHFTFRPFLKSAYVAYVGGARLDPHSQRRPMMFGAGSPSLSRDSPPKTSSILAS